MSNTVLDKGRVRYIEPTNITLEREGTFSDSINFPYEDYNMAVDLNIRKVDRYSCGWWKEGGEYKDVTFSSKNGTISFLGGTRGYSSLNNMDDSYLTTNFTDISMLEPENNTSECLGIESISITYNSWMYPQVVVKFVDIRGATVMQPAERGYYNPNDVGISSELYKSLFTFPYPIFTLKVKGFYGKGVTYKLAVEKTELEFDANTGNFNITVNFIGYMFGIYADIPMTYLAIAPYTKEGRAYWKKKISDGVFRFRDGSGIDSFNMMTIPELRLKLAMAANNEDSVSAAADGEQVQNNFDEQLSKLGAIRDSMPFKDWFETRDAAFLYKVVKAEEEMEDFRNTVSGFVTTISGYDETYGTKYISEMGDLVKYAQDGKGMIVIDFVRVKNSEDPTDTSYKDDHPLFGESNKEKYERCVEPYEEVKRYIKQTRGSLTNFYLYIFPKNNGIFNSSVFKEKLDSEVKDIREKKTRKEEEYKQKKASAIEKALGFRPSIKNIYDLMFAHMETFMHCFYSTTKAIKDQLEQNSDSRKKSHYDIIDGDTDTENEKIKIGGTTTANVDARSSYLPPYAAYYKETYTNNETKKVLRWPGELRNGNNLEEVHFVESLLAAAELYGERAEEVEDMIATMTAPVSGGQNNIASSLSSDAPSPFVNTFIPLSTYDFINKDQMGNPYDSVRDKVYYGDDEVTGEILGIFALRAFYYLSTNRGDGLKDAKSFGVLEAINMYKAIKDKYSAGFRNFIKKFANDNRTNRNTFIDAITTTKLNEYTKIWNTDAPNLNKNLFRKQGGRLFYDYHKGFKIGADKINEQGYVDADVMGNDYTKASSGTTYKMYPLYFSDFSELRKKYVYEKRLLNDSSFISVVNDGVVYGGDDDRTSTFYKFETRDYIKNVFDCLDQEVTNTQNYLKEHNKEYGKRKSDEYGSIKNSNRTMKNYKDNIESSFGEKSYEKDIIVDSAEKPISLSEVKNTLSTGLKSDQKNFYIMYPAVVDEDEDKSLFDEDIYKIQTDIKAKAFLFLQSVPVRGSGKSGGIEKENMNGLSLKARLLREGSYYWREDYFRENEEDPIIYSAMTSDGKRIPSNSFKVPSSAQTFTGDLWSDGYETLKMLHVTDGGDYVKWERPLGETASRRKSLKKYFEEWATSTDSENGFAANEQRLCNKKLYNKDPKFLQREKKASENSRNYGQGLDIDGLAATDKHSPDAEDAKYLQTFLRDLFFTVCTTIDLYNGSDNYSVETLNCSESAMRSAFEGFMEELELIYGEVVKDMKGNSDEFSRRMAEIESQNPFQNDDLRLSTYMTLKSLYDKWLCSPYNGPSDTWVLNRTPDSISDFDNFIYTDTFYHDIGYQLLVNITKVESWLSSCLPTSNLNTTEGVMGYTGRTLYEFLAEVAQDCGGTLLALPQKFGLNTVENINNMFKPISIQNNWDEDSSSFIFMYTYKPSEHLGSVDPGNMDMNGWSSKGDGVDLTDEEIVGKVFSDSSPYTIPAFGVTYAKQNQSIFKNIRLNTVSAGVTEASLAATFNIASKSSEAPRESTLYGQDLYRVFSQYSYQCAVEMMGNMQITPLMFFQLNNVPMWKGAYMIKKVSHNITAGNISTSFEGVRINRYAIPLTDSAVILAKDTGDKIADATGSTATIAGGDNNVTTGEGGMVAKGVDKGEVNINGNPNKALNSDIDFDESNITEKKPIICLTPAHGPKTQKRQEWEWSVKLLDRIISKLSKYNFSDGTSYAKNIQYCNKNGKNTNKGYSMVETKNIIEKYGSKKVISVVPHWNGGAGNYHITFIDKLSNGPREDSKRLAECFQSEFIALKGEKNNLNIPTGMMNGDCRLLNFWEDRWDAEKQKMIYHTDGAPQQKCACVLTENWFADYPSGTNWSSEPPASGSGREWLISEEGIEKIAEAHAKAIKRYIDSL